MSTKMRGFRSLSKSLHPMVWTKVASALEELMLCKMDVVVPQVLLCRRQLLVINNNLHVIIHFFYIFF